MAASKSWRKWAQSPPLCPVSTGVCAPVCEVGRWLSGRVYGQHSMCVIWMIVYIYPGRICTHRVGVTLRKHPPTPAFSAASEGVDTVRSGFILTALDYIKVNFAPTGCLLIMAIGRSQCCLDPIGLAGEPSRFVLILSLIRLEEPIRISCAGFLEVSYFLILIIMRWWVISRSHSLCFAPCFPLLVAFHASLGHIISQPPPLPRALGTRGEKDMDNICSFAQGSKVGMSFSSISQICSLSKRAEAKSKRVVNRNKEWH